MAFDKNLVGVKKDGTPRYEYDYKGQPGDTEGNTGGLLITGPISGTVTLSDGTSYDVTPEVIEHAAGHAGPIAHHIDKLHESYGGLPVGPNMVRVPFTHTCTDFCGDEKAA